MFISMSTTRPGVVLKSPQLSGSFHARKAGLQAFAFRSRHGSVVRSKGRTSPKYEVARTVRLDVTAMEEMETMEVDVAIIGGGPAGCTAAVYTARSDLTTVILDKSPSIGALAITHQIANYPGVPTDTSGQALLDTMRDQAIEFGAEYRRAQVFGVAVDDEWKTVYSPVCTVKAKTLILATGAMGRPPTFTGEDTYLGKGVSYCATCDGAFYRDAEVCVVGMNSEAIEEAEHLTKFASKVHWITPTKIPEDNHEALGLAAKDNVKHWQRTRLLEIQGGDGGVTGIQIKSKMEGEEEMQVLPLEGVFVYIAGSKPITEFLDYSGIALREDGGVIVDETMKTNLDGVFAVGDIRNTPYKQAVVAASDGCIAAMAIDQYLNKRKTVKLDWVHQ